MQALPQINTPAARAAVASVERAPLAIHASSAAASRAVAHHIADLIRARAAAGKHAVLGLATGSTPQGVYEELVRLHTQERLSFKNVITFNLDEYWPMKPEDLQSYHRFMHEHLFSEVDIPASQINVPDGTIPREQTAAYCADYEKRIADAGGLDLQILGIGRTGHFGFNEPGSSRESQTRLITLDRVTRMDAASDFFGEWNVPKQAITMGVGTILAARQIVLLAFGEHKAPVIRRAVEGDISITVAASFLQEHDNAQFVLDAAAAAELTRCKTPWTLGPLSQFGLEWDDTMTKKACCWLAKTTEKPILKLTDEDYNEHHLQELIAARGEAYDTNKFVFKQLQQTITGWPGGKKGRPKFVAGKGVTNDNPIDPTESKRVVVFSPHPDDDVISMGGTFIRLCDQGHDVHVAYQTSGNIAVFDDEAIRHADFVGEVARAFKLMGESDLDDLERRIEHFAKSKTPGEPDTEELRTIKTLIRRTEARAGARYSGVKPDRIHFLDMPFYETGLIKKSPLTDADIQIIIDLLDTVKPHLIYAAGDLSDPHGTHRVCLSAITTALHRMQTDGNARDWIADTELWLYRGAWQEWEPNEIEMAVPLSPSEVDRKRTAIFKHQSQKDKALFPGPWDTREFWQRAEDRNRATADVYDALGLPEYQAIEGFVLWRPSEQDNTLADSTSAVEAKPVPTTRSPGVHA